MKTIPYSANIDGIDVPVQMTITRSFRKTVGLKIRSSRDVVLKFPMYCQDSDVDEFLKKKKNWIDYYIYKAGVREQETEDLPKLTYGELEKLFKDTSALLRPLLDEYIPMLRVTVRKVTVRAQRTRWGSCSSRGNLNFNCLLALTPDYVQRYIVVHELCHLLNMNHSPAFWAGVATIMPDYETAEDWIKEEGWKLFRRLP